jgi:hypothetical protein
MLHVLAFRECKKSRIVPFKHDADTPRLSTRHKKNCPQNFFSFIREFEKKVELI